MRSDALAPSATTLPFRLSAQARQPKLEAFNRRSEIEWFGFQGSYAGSGTAVVAPARLHDGALGGGGVRALNGGIISAGFDAVFVLAGLGHFDSEVVVTLELSTRFLSLARLDSPVEFAAGVVRSSRHVAFAQGALSNADGQVFATATAILAPAAGS